MPLVNITSSESSTSKITSIASTSNTNIDNALQSTDWINHSIDIKVEHGNNVSVNSNETKAYNFHQNHHLQQQHQHQTTRHHHRIMDENDSDSEVLVKRKRLIKSDIDTRGKIFNFILQIILNKFVLN